MSSEQIQNIETDQIDHSHDHHQNNKTRVFCAFLLTASFMIVEVIGGVISGSLALIADAGHMLTDAGSLALAWYAFKLSEKPADELRSFGYYRFQVLAAFINGVALLAIVLWIAFEAVTRLLEPVQVMGWTMLWIAIAGLFVNITAFLILHGASKQNLNIRGAVLHVLGDMLGSAAAILAAGVILWTGWMPIDPLLSLLVAALISWNAWDLVKRSGHILLEGSPENFDMTALKKSLLENVKGIQDVHHVHAWSLTPEKPLLTLHVNVAPENTHDEILHDIKDHLIEKFGIEHSTVQIENQKCRLDNREKNCH